MSIFKRTVLLYGMITAREYRDYYQIVIRRVQEFIMAEENKLSEPKQLKTHFVGDAELPMHFVNAVNIRAGLEEFYFTLGTTTPLEVSDLKELEQVEAINAQALFRFAVTRTVMKQIIDLMQAVYEAQTQQMNMLQALQEKEREHDSDSTIS